MAITRASLANREALATWLQENAVPGFFKTVTYTSGTDSIACTDADDNTILEIKDGNGNIYAYRATGNSIHMSESNQMLGGYRMDVIGCDNGFIIENALNNGSGQIDMLVTKTNNDKIAIIWGYSSSSKTTGRTSGIQHVAWGDSETLATTTGFTPEAGQQTVLVPFVTNANIESISYTPDAFWISMNFNYNMGIGKFRMGGDMFISNGYWAIRDGQSE